MNEILVKRLTEDEKKKLRIPVTPIVEGIWAVWECAPSEFDWQYDCQERAYVYEGEVTVKTAQGSVTIAAGDYVVFPAGLTCHWSIYKKIRKVYTFD